MLAVLEIKNIGVNPSGENQVKGCAEFSQMERGEVKESRIAIAAKGQIAQELANYTRGIATGYLRFVRLENADGNKTTRVSLIVESFSPLEGMATSKNNRKKAVECKAQSIPAIDDLDGEIPF